MNYNIKNIAASVRTRLKSIADKEHKQFDFILMLYMIERLLFRLSNTRYKDCFILKGGLLLYTIMQDKARPTKDIDFLAKQMSNEMDSIQQVFKEICSVDYNDGLKFDINSMITEKIKEDEEYEGVRVKVKCFLDNAVKILIKLRNNSISFPEPSKREAFSVSKPFGIFKFKKRLSVLQLIVFSYYI